MFRQLEEKHLAILLLSKISSIKIVYSESALFRNLLNLVADSALLSTTRCSYLVDFFSLNLAQKSQFSAAICT